jgi:4-hydroxy-3-methylbut-2-en-1-yl diphosphate synthase IspG/GcpE
MAIKYTNITKIYPNLDFWFETMPSGNPCCRADAGQKAREKKVNTVVKNASAEKKNVRIGVKMTARLLSVVVVNLPLLDLL